MSSRSVEVKFLLRAAAFGPALVASGCHERTAKAAAPVAAAPAAREADAKPLTVIAPDTDATPPTQNVTPPPSPATTAVATLPVEPAHKPAPPPRKQNTETASDVQPEPPSRPATPAPQISPQLSPGDQASLQRKTSDDVGVAQKNLQQSSGRVLSAAQHDLVEKIQSFLAQSGEASKAGDWARAQNLSQKARLLSVELVDSL
jgi:outer membrane biosynthesis protein TonB